MTRALPLAIVTAICLQPLHGATLERLTLSDMAAQSTAIVRATVGSSYATLSGAVVYTHYKLQVSERLKGPAVSEFVVRGGISGGVQQVVPGTPHFASGGEYVFFLWAAPDGSNHIIGLTQGMFAVAPGGAADPSVTRNASHELMLDPKTARPVKDETLVMRMSDLRSQIAAALAGGTGKQ